MNQSSSSYILCLFPWDQEFEEFWPFKSLLAELSKRLSYCVTAELVPLMEVAGVLEVSSMEGTCALWGWLKGFPHVE